MTVLPKEFLCPLLPALPGVGFFLDCSSLPTDRRNGVVSRFGRVSERPAFVMPLAMMCINGELGLVPLLRRHPGISLSRVHLGFSLVAGMRGATLWSTRDGDCRHSGTVQIALVNCNSLQQPKQYSYQKAKMAMLRAQVSCILKTRKRRMSV